MSKEHDRKTNAMRVLDAAGTPYEARSSTAPRPSRAMEVARILELDPDTVFKTLVTRGKVGEHYVFMIPVACERGSQKRQTYVNEKDRGDDPLARAAALDRLRTRGLLASRHEKRPSPPPSTRRASCTSASRSRADASAARSRWRPTTWRAQCPSSWPISPWCENA